MNKLLALLLLLFAQLAPAQQIVFKMSAFGINFGNMTVNHVKENDSVELYTLKASGYLKVLWMERKDETINEVRYCNGRLISSTYRQTENATVKRWTKINRTGEQLVVDSYKGKRTVKELPAFSIIRLYFQYPQNITRLFYEAEAEYIALTRTDDPNTFETRTDGGNRSVYHYVNGAINQVEFHIPAATVYAKRM